MDMLKSVHIEGFKSIRDATIDLGPLTVLIGANGSGKSNFISFLRMMKAISEDQLETVVGRAGGADKMLFFGASTTESIAVELSTEAEGQASAFRLQLAYIEGDELLPVYRLDNVRGDDSLPIFSRSWQFHHLSNTSSTSAIRQSHYIEDNRALLPDASNLAPYLYMLRETRRPYYDRIISAFRLAAPWFGDFILEPRELDPTRILLNWREKGRETLFGPHQLSDGSLRTIALFTLLLQPEDRLPSLIVIDEPELGLHPYAITLLASLIRSASLTCQVLVATQSVTLVDEFAPEEIVVVDRDREGGTTFKRHSEDELVGWLEHYSVGELWLKNVIGGRP